jgi:cysteine synthase
MLQDNMVTIPDGAAVAMAQSLARNEGILTVSYSF